MIENKAVEFECSGGPLDGKRIVLLLVPGQREFFFPCPLEDLSAVRWPQDREAVVPLGRLVYEVSENCLLYKRKEAWE